MSTTVPYLASPIQSGPCNPIDVIHQKFQCKRSCVQPLTVGRSTEVLLCRSGGSGASLVRASVAASIGETMVLHAHVYASYRNTARLSQPHRTYRTKERTTHHRQTKKPNAKSQAPRRLRPSARPLSPLVTYRLHRGSSVPVSLAPGSCLCLLPPLLVLNHHFALILHCGCIGQGGRKGGGYT